MQLKSTTTCAHLHEILHMLSIFMPQRSQIYHGLEEMACICNMVLLLLKQSPARLLQNHIHLFQMPAGGIAKRRLGHPAHGKKAGWPKQPRTRDQ